MSYYTTSKGRRIRKETPPVRYKECRICRKPLDQKPKGRPRKTCSDACRQVVARGSQNAMSRRSNNKRINDTKKRLRAMERAAGKRVNDEKTAEHMWMGDRTRLLIRMGMGQIVPVCAVCRLPFVEEFGVKEIYCSEVCHKEGHQRAELLLRAKNAWDGDYNPHLDIRVPLDVPVRPCENCLKPFSARNPKKRFCNDKCRNAHWYSTHRKCARCRKTFEVNPHAKETHRYCSKDCREKAWKGRMLEANRENMRAEVAMRTCEDCGKPLELNPGGQKRKRFCNKTCSSRKQQREERRALGIRPRQAAVTRRLIVNTDW
jgi:hypothetical protein